MSSSSQGVESLGALIAISVICLFGVTSNLMVIFITVRKLHNRKSATSLFILNLAASDVILAGITLPIILMDAYIPEFTTSDVECKVKMALPLFNITSSIFTMVAMSFERVRSIVQQTTTSFRQATVAVIVIWIVALVTTAPQFYEYGLSTKRERGEDEEEAAGDDNETGVACSSAEADPVFVMAYACVILVLAYLLPLACVTKNYLHVVCFLVKRGSRLQGFVSKVKIRVLRMLIVVTLVFALLWLPFFVLFAIEEVTGTDSSTEASSTPHVVKQIFVALSSVSNPLVYFCLSSDYRHQFLSLLCPCQSFGNKTAPSSDDSEQLSSNRRAKVGNISTVERLFSHRMPVKTVAMGTPHVLQEISDFSGSAEAEC